MKCERSVSQVKLWSEANFKAPLLQHFVNIGFTTTIEYVHISPRNFPGRLECEHSGLKETDLEVHVVVNSSEVWHNCL
jgi:hypothetical protein